MLYALAAIALVGIVVGICYLFWWGIIALAFSVFSYNHPVTHGMVFLAIIINASIHGWFSAAKKKD